LNDKEDVDECIVVCLMRGLLVPESGLWTLYRALVRAEFGDAHNMFGEMPERVPVAPIEPKLGGDDPRSLVRTRV
jgi:hypothetical protein